MPATPSPAWVVLTVDLDEDAADPMASFLADEGVPSLVTGVHEAREGEEPVPGRTRLEAHVPAAEADRLEGCVRRFAAELESLVPGWAPIAVARRAEEAGDWIAAFRAHHRPLPVGRRLLVAPPWDVPPSHERIVLVVEPAMAFGTGQHPTTRTCLEEVEELVALGEIRSALDVGTGSGILAAALARLGVPRVVALDVDPSALAEARVTCVRNGAATVRLLAGRAAAVDEVFDLVVANLLADALVEEAETLASRVGPGGRLVVSGLLAEQRARVVAAYPDWRVTRGREDPPWQTLRLERRP